MGFEYAESESVQFYPLVEFLSTLKQYGYYIFDSTPVPYWLQM